ncbi:uncharacterized protein LOC132200019 [Neocloeon triangulifer]|uniref:uncharacterized protein LOC132200019 n=1 Tax=Neocloeon triangulifer TaxID=2078957 RepID=UPI00286F7951|nr:uncharacterized protein LOC132200019 [Neocloeon triangulifer]
MSFAQKLSLAMLLLCSAVNAEAPKKRTVVSSPSGYEPYTSDGSNFNGRFASSAGFASPSYAGYASPSFSYAPAGYASPAAYKAFTPSIPYTENTFRPSSYSAAPSVAYTSNPVQASYRPAAATYTSLPGYANNLAGLSAYSNGAQFSAGLNPGIFNLAGLNSYSGVSGLEGYGGFGAYNPSDALGAYPAGFRQQQQAYPQQVVYAQQGSAYPQQGSAYRQQDSAYLQQGAAFPQQAYQQSFSSPLSYSASAPLQQRLVAQASSNKVGPATFGAHGGQPTSAASSVTNGGYGFIRPNSN